VAEPLGAMRYRCMATPDFRRRWFPRGMTRVALSRAPVIVFNRKDRLQAEFVERHFGLRDHACPRHAIPASEPFLQAICLGLGWGMLPELQLDRLPDHGGLIDLRPDAPIDVSLYWHSWKAQSPRLEKMSARLIAAARGMLR
jgi:LysR family transcriptional regulator (chromosome initiation inhibitor)